MKSASIALFFSALALFSSNSNAEAETGWRTIAQMGCHTVDYTCYMTLNGPAFGPAGCTSNQLRWSMESMPNAKIFMAHMTAALATGQQVNILVSDACYSSWPTLKYYYVASP